MRRYEVRVVNVQAASPEEAAKLVLRDDIASNHTADEFAYVSDMDDSTGGEQVVELINL